MASNFQPQVGDTTNGPHVHTYIPREDGTILIGGTAYIPKAPMPAVANVMAPAQGTVVQPAVQTPFYYPQYPYYPHNVAFPTHFYLPPASLEV
jgi:hypothetical protein